jgi:hypothetical protein
VDGVVDLREEPAARPEHGWNANNPGKVWKDLIILTPGGRSWPATSAPT